MPEDLVDVAGVAKLLWIPAEAVKRRVSLGRLIPRRLRGGKVGFLRSEILTARRKYEYGGDDRNDPALG